MANRVAVEGNDRTAVVYIAYGPYGAEPFERFLNSYRRFAAGAPHDLIVAWKNVTAAELAAFRSSLESVLHQGINVPDGGLDLGTYRHIATSTAYARYCFLNSNSEVRAHDWLAKLGAALDRPGVVAAGATASYQSLATDMLRRVGMRRTLRALAIAKRHVLHLRLRRLYPPFPNPHLRTNAFLIGRSDFLTLRIRPLKAKEDATRFESGWQGMTRQLGQSGGAVVIVDAHGQSHAVDDWFSSATFWQEDQQSLLVADNQTRRYAEADVAEQRTLFRYAWTALGD